MTFNDRRLKDCREELAETREELARVKGERDEQLRLKNQVLDDAARNQADHLRSCSWSKGHEAGYRSAACNFQVRAETAETERDQARERVRVLEEALRQVRIYGRKIATILIAIEGHLSEPYPDDPRWTPWTRFGQRAFDRCKSIHNVIDAALAETTNTEEET